MTNSYLESKTHERHPAWGATWGFLLPMCASYVADSIILSLFGVHWLVCCRLSKSIVGSYSRSWIFLLSWLARFVTFDRKSSLGFNRVAEMHYPPHSPEPSKAAGHELWLQIDRESAKYCSVSDFQIDLYTPSSTNNQNPSRLFLAYPCPAKVRRGKLQKHGPHSGTPPDVTAPRRWIRSDPHATTGKEKCLSVNICQHLSTCVNLSPVYTVLNTSFFGKRKSSEEHNTPKRTDSAKLFITWLGTEINTSLNAMHSFDTPWCSWPTIKAQCLEGAKYAEH